MVERHSVLQVSGAVAGNWSRKHLDYYFSEFVGSSREEMEIKVPELFLCVYKERKGNGR